ncbi:uncharacterized protein LOC127726055 isoform X4 [Mytilus californianus]|uniref:uncharacterized protein LOC127726055 isoform X4 n=1 Tax=Mytilus californianus TaxID=6549 RepID=UPI00224559DC|nr:uncharacterized protein LOC127726055 isoform X4 [Mytilus californianus]
MATGGTENEEIVQDIIFEQTMTNGGGRSTQILSSPDSGKNGTRGQTGLFQSFSHPGVNISEKQTPTSIARSLSKPEGSKNSLIASLSVKSNKQSKVEKSPTGKKKSVKRKVLDALKGNKFHGKDNSILEHRNALDTSLGAKPKLSSTATKLSVTTNAEVNPARNSISSSITEIIVSKDSIADLDVDVIVSSEDSAIQSGGMVAKIIAEKGGHLLEVCKDCLRKMCSTIAYWTFQPTPATEKLKCKHIFHAVVPQFSIQNQDKWTNGLRSLLKNIISRTEFMGYESLGVPLIGTGKNGAPTDFVIDLVCESVNQLSPYKTSTKGLKTVIIVHPDKRVRQIIEERVKLLQNDAPKQTTKIPHKTTKVNGKKYIRNVEDRKTDTCPICLEEMSGSKLRQLSRCNHIFCKKCLEECFKRMPTCPVCNMVYGELTGNQPEGIMMECFQNDVHLPGYKDCGLIKIFYSFLGGKQLKGHPNPGKSYEGTKRVAYLPDNSEGQKVHRLLRRAFQQRILFTIGSSRTTGKEDVVTWNDVHHKTRIDGGPARFGYPDPEYISRVLDELAAKGITEE